MLKIQVQHVLLVEVLVVSLSLVLASAPVPLPKAKLVLNELAKEVCLVFDKKFMVASGSL